MHGDMAMELEALPAATIEGQQRDCDLWRADFNNCRPHESLGMRTPSEVYKPSATAYVGAKVELLYLGLILAPSEFHVNLITQGCRLLRKTPKEKPRHRDDGDGALGDPYGT